MDSFDSAYRDCERLAALLVAACAERGVTVATAESLTAGMVSSFIAGVPGASCVLLGAAVTYTNEVKEAVLGVSPQTIASVTEVSSEVACQMADGAACVFGADVAVSLTGYAGPGGGTDSNPVGTVYIGLHAQGESSSRRFAFEGDRRAVRVSSAREALAWLLSSVQSME